MTGIATLNFLKNLEKNNNRNWFEAHRDEYENAKADILATTGKLIPAISRFDTTIAEQIAKNCIFRINRDVRFSKNKSPYKNHMAAYFNKAGKKGIGAGYYLHIEPGKSFAATGIWMPEPAALAKIRQEIDYNFDEWKKILNHSGFKKLFPAGLENSNILARAPKGYTDDNPALPFLKLKSFVVTRQLPDEIILDKAFVKNVSKIFQVAYPFIGFLNGALE